ncbi:MAG: hypothetical protein WA160_14360 [Pseudobdellovibrio sp.]
MRFNVICTAFISCFAISHLVACAPSKINDKGNENVIGQKLEAMTPLRATDGSEKQTIAIYDPIVKKVHQFDLNLMIVDRTLSVLNPDDQHFVLHSGLSNYIIDLSEKHVSIFDKNSVPQHQPVKFQGKPISSAFRPDLGLLIIYDDLQSVGVIKLAQDGQVLDSHTFGAVVSDDNSIISGDLRDDGHLILGLTDNSIADVDVQACLSAKTWLPPVIHMTTLTKINWIAPLAGILNHKLLIKTNDQVVLFDLNTNTIIDHMDIKSTDVIKLSKSYNPHVIVSTSLSSMDLIFTDGNFLKKRSIQILNSAANDQYVYPILSSDLDLANDTWTYVYIKKYYGNILFNNVNERTENRTLVRMRVSDGLSLQSKQIVDNAQIKLGADFFFALYPSVLGKAQKFSIADDSSQVIERFNLKKF